MKPNGNVGERAGRLAGEERLRAAPATRLVRRSLRWRLRIPATAAAACQAEGAKGCAARPMGCRWAVCLVRQEQRDVDGRLTLGWRGLLKKLIFCITWQSGGRQCHQHAWVLR